MSYRFDSIRFRENAFVVRQRERILQANGNPYKTEICGRVAANAANPTTTATEQSFHGTGRTYDKKKEPTTTGSKGVLRNCYKIVHGSSGGTRLLAFGFLYNMDDYSRDAGNGIETVQSVVAQDWFKAALTEEHYNAISAVGVLVRTVTPTILVQIVKYEVINIDFGDFKQGPETSGDHQNDQLKSTPPTNERHSPLPL